MKKIFLLTCLFVTISFSMSRCTSKLVIEPEEEEETTDPDDEEIERTFFVSCSANFAGKIHSYAYVDMKPDIPSIIWSRDDLKAELNVGLFLKGDSLGEALLPYNHDLKIKSSGNTLALAEITVKTKEKRGELYAYYPHQTSVSGTTLSYKLNNIQDQSVADSLMDSSLNSNMLMISEPSSTFVLKGGTPVINLKSVFSILRFRVNYSPEMSILRPVKKITVYIANKDRLEVPLEYKLAGNYSIDLSKAPESPGYAGPEFSSTNYNNTITAQLSNSPLITPSSTNPSAWLIVNPTKINADDRLVAIVEMDGYKIISQHQIAEIKPNTVYDIHVVAKKDNTVSDQVLTYFLKDKASNCYIISQAGLCQIPLYKINGESLSGKGDTVVWLWASKEKGGNNFSISELIDPLSIIKNDSTEVENGNFNYIRFRVGTDFGKYTKGNVMLALKKSNAIVWSWHIWITDEPKELEHQDNKRFLDRNIGALSAQLGNSPIDHFGFVYQWGRKDPFFGGDGNANETATNSLAIATNNTIRNTGVTWQRVPSTQTADYARLNPMVFICNNTSSSDLNVPVDWLLGSSIPSRWIENAKTNNDPCPPGYRVPNKDELSILHDADTLNKPTNPNLWFFTNGQWNWEYFFSKSSSSSMKSYWPAQGMRMGRWSFRSNVGGQHMDGGTPTLRGQCYYWTSSPVILQNNVTLPGGSHRIHTTGALLYSKDDFGDNADAYPVRCIKYTP